MSLRVALPCLIPMLWLIACDRKQPVEPALEAGAMGAGPTVRAPSNTSASAVSDTRIDVSWQDNATNETGFEVWRSPSGLDGTFTKLAGTGASVASYGDAGLTASTKYCYRIRAFRNYDGKTSYSDLSNTACVATLAPPPPPAPPKAPFGTNTRPGNSSTADISWTDNSADEDGFRIERAPDPAGTWATAGSVPANRAGFQDTGLASEQRVCYRVVAFNRGGDSPPSNTRCTTPPAAPTGVTATGVDGPTIDLAWTDNSAAEDGYQVERSTDGVTFSHLSNVAMNLTSWHDGAVTSNTTYWYRVRARKDGGFSDFSNIASGTAGIEVPPAAPALTASNLQYGLSNIQLIWWASSYNQDGFKVERCEAVNCDDADFTMIATLGATSSDYLDTDVQPGSTYTYRVRAFNRAGDSPASEITATACFVFIDSDGFYGCS